MSKHINNKMWCWICNPDPEYECPYICDTCNKKRETCWGCHPDLCVGTPDLCGKCEYENQNTKYRPPLVFKIPDRIKPHSAERGPCVPRSMIGRSWWKKNGFNDDCHCAWTAEFEKQKTQNRCDLCDDGYYEKNRGHSASPISENKICCDSCNQNVIVPARIQKQKTMSWIERVVKDIELKRQTSLPAFEEPLYEEAEDALKYISNEDYEYQVKIANEMEDERQSLVQLTYKRFRFRKDLEDLLPDAEKIQNKKIIEEMVEFININMYERLLEMLNESFRDFNRQIRAKQKEVEERILQEVLKNPIVEVEVVVNKSQIKLVEKKTQTKDANKARDAKKKQREDFARQVAEAEKALKAKEARDRQKAQAKKQQAKK